MIEGIQQSGRLQRNLELIVRTGLRMTRETDLKTLMQSAADAGLELCGAQVGAFFLNVTGSAGDNQPISVLSGVNPESFAQFPMVGNLAIFPPAFEGVGFVRFGDISKDLRNRRPALQYGNFQGRLPVRSYLALPVKTQPGEVLGGLFYGHEAPDAFEEEGEDLVAMVATEAGMAIEALQLREQLNSKIRELEEGGLRHHEAARHLNELAAIVESSDDAIIGKDLDGRVTSWNRAASRIFGYKQEEIMGESILKLIPKELHSEEPAILARIRAGERIDHFETVRLTKSGERLDVSLTVSPVRDASGTIVGASKILRDFTEKKRIETSLIQSEKIAAMGRMAATIAHEINNPLEAIMNLIFLARTNASNQRMTAELLATAEGEMSRVSHLARQTLGFYRENVSAASASLSDLAAAAAGIYGPRCNAAKISIEKNLKSTRPIVLRKGEIMQVISNLISNAFHAMPSGGGISISVEDAETPDGPGSVLTVQDNGVGIPAERLPRIFDAFFTTRGSTGTGIGLFVAKQFVEGHGGRIAVESSIDPISHGTRMTVFLPFDNPRGVKA